MSVVSKPHPDPRFRRKEKNPGSSGNEDVVEQITCLCTHPGIARDIIVPLHRANARSFLFRLPTQSTNALDRDMVIFYKFEKTRIVNPSSQELQIKIAIPEQKKTK